MSFLLGIAGVAVGAVLQFWFNVLLEEHKKKDQRALDDKRKVLLRSALENMPADAEWRKLTTLCGIIGAEPRETTRLLIELGARGSESDEDVWALLSDKPLKRM
ncbi:hypothetical protein [Roseibium sp. SCP14]|uniref:hypothetical protein n=1 Tax=Roseibium sp. SCP14 TaxID=3141375 RepID=UPI00333AA2E8